VGTGTHVREAQHVAHVAENNEVAHEITKLHEFDAIVGITLLDGDHLNFDVGINHPGPMRESSRAVRRVAINQW
jgi:hypothetical protein